MVYEPTSSDAMSVYMIAANHHVVLPNPIDQPNQADVKRTSLGAFRIMPRERHEASGRRLEDIAICMYDKKNELWYVRLQDGAIVKVRDLGDGLVVTD
jgi:hypothetical protein